MQLNNDSTQHANRITIKRLDEKTIRTDQRKAEQRKNLQKSITELYNHVTTKLHGKMQNKRSKNITNAFEYT